MCDLLTKQLLTKLVEYSLPR